MSMRKKVEALELQRSEKLAKLRLLASDKNVPEEDREKAKQKLSKFRALLVQQQAQASRNGGTKTRLREATQ